MEDRRVYNPFSPVWETPALQLIQLESALLDGRKGINPFGTGHRAPPDIAALVEAMSAGERLRPYHNPLVPRVIVVSERERQGRGADELPILLIDRASGVAESAVNAQARLQVLGLLLRGLKVLTLLLRLLLPANKPRGDPLQLRHKVSDIDDEIPDDGKTLQRLDDNYIRLNVPRVCLTGQPRRAVDHGPAAAAHTHPAGPSEGQRRIHLVLEMVQIVQDDSAPLEGEAKFLVATNPLLRQIPPYLEGNRPSALLSRQYLLSSGLHFVTETGACSTIGSSVPRSTSVW